MRSPSGDAVAGPASRPEHLDTILWARGLRVLKHVPAMAVAIDAGRRPRAGRFRTTLCPDFVEFFAAEHRFIGPPTTNL